ncbi:MAG: adenylate/guanylate cyclase domain-containing protein, partial [Acidimicrobiia bacterium]|nr:adenylate/guanylate cyclase domain-containing protein [Acidimicrobiia bacterium]
MVTTIPTGVVSFLFTDVEGSTRLWESDAEGMASSLALHDQVMRRVIDRHRGHVFSTAGDAFAVSFATSGAAVAAATAIQLELLRSDWPGPPIKIRMGIHTGTAEERDGDYFGPVLNRAARIMSSGHGGQILISSVTAEAADLDGDLTLRDLGTHHLKDLDEPEHLFEIRHPELPLVERPIKTVDIRRHNLPDYLTTFVGRKKQLDELAALLDENRLVSLTGVGGTGKTRL